MIKGQSILLILTFVSGISCNAQTLRIKECLQEQDQWCWAAATQCILDYYGFDMRQCEIVNYARNHSTPPRYGQEDCCEFPSDYCNKAGYFGLGFEYFANLSINITGVLSLEEIFILLNERKPIAISNSDHVVIIYGIKNSKVYIMDPADGFYVLDYDELIDFYGWKASYVPQRAPINVLANESKISIFPNPTTGTLNLSLVLQNQEKTIVEVFNIQGVRIVQREYRSSYVLSTIADDLKPGLYFIKINGESFKYIEKLIVN